MNVYWTIRQSVEPIFDIYIYIRSQAYLYAQLLDVYIGHLNELNLCRRSRKLSGRYVHIHKVVII